jgi:hypothetical protein
VFSSTIDVLQSHSKIIAGRVEVEAQSSFETLKAETLKAEMGQLGVRIASRGEDSVKEA